MEFTFWENQTGHICELTEYNLHSIFLTLVFNSWVSVTSSLSSRPQTTHKIQTEKCTECWIHTVILPSETWCVRHPQRPLLYYSELSRTKTTLIVTKSRISFFELLNEEKRKSFYCSKITLDIDSYKSSCLFGIIYIVQKTLCRVGYYFCTNYNFWCYK